MTRRIWMQQTLVVLGGLALAIIMVLLGFWQLRVYTAQGSATADRRASAPAVPLGSVATAGSAVPDGYGRTVTATGRYRPDLQVLVPGPAADTFRVVTALELADGSLVAVVRGTVTGSTDRVRAPVPAAGAVTQSGILLPSEETAAGPPPPDGQLTSVRLPQLAQQWSGPLVNGFITLGADQAKEQELTPATVTLPEGRGRLRNGAYAIQWWLFAGFTLVMAGRMARDFGRREDFEGGNPKGEPSEAT